MFRKEFAEVISSMGMVPIKDLKPLLKDDREDVISELSLLDLSFFDDIRFAKQLAERNKLTFINLSKAKIKDSNFKLIKKSQALKYRIVPVQKTSEALSLAIYDPTVMKYKVEIQTIFQYPVKFILTNIASWKKIFGNIKDSLEDLLKTVEEVTTAANDDEAENIVESDIGDDVILLVNKILVVAYMHGASDIHIEPYQTRLRTRLRVDGILQEVDSPSKKHMLPVISRLKIMAQMDISEKKKPQDGRIKIKIGSKEIDYRVSSLPTLYGEKIVLRILDQSNLNVDMTKLGFENDQIEHFQDGINRPFGMCLVTGPTGSGKTTTLYSALAELNKVTHNIATAEDPVEFNFEGINQVNVKKGYGLEFADALKSFLRQDPDIIMVGEIRDLEVGEIAVEAALTGHLVLSTLHTNDAPSAVTRLLNMGIEPFLVVGSLNMVVAQRLCRRVCVNCRDVDEVPINYLVHCGIERSSAEKVKVYKGKGCFICNNTGYKGRVAIHEVMMVEANIRELVLKNASADQIKKQAIKNGMRTLRMSALTKVVKGLTTLDEAVKNSSVDKF